MPARQGYAVLGWAIAKGGNLPEFSKKKRVLLPEGRQQTAQCPHPRLCSDLELRTSSASGEPRQRDEHMFSSDWKRPTFFFAFGSGSVTYIIVFSEDCFFFLNLEEPKREVSARCIWSTCLPGLCSVLLDQCKYLILNRLAKFLFFFNFHIHKRNWPKGHLQFCSLYAFLWVFLFFSIAKNTFAACLI